MTWVISRLSIQGVKGVLDRAGEFGLSPKEGKPRSIALFGRNGCGKSGYADAVEYLFSSDGEVRHLGKGGADSELGGKHAIPHVLAAEKNISPQITIECTELETNKKIKTTRAVIVGRNDNRPEEISSILSQSPAHRILRQHDLRRFVVDMSPGEKFAEFARWVGLESSANLLKHLTTAENTLKETSVDREMAERLKTIESHTSGKITSYNLPAILDWCEKEISRHISPPLSIQNVTCIHNAVQALCLQRENIIIQSQTARTHHMRENLKKCATSLVDKNGDICALPIAIKNAIQAEKVKIEAQSKASQRIFQEVWESSQKFLKEQKTEICPICQTPWNLTKAGSSENALVILDKSLASLSEFKKADALYLQQRQNVSNHLGKIQQSLTEIIRLAQTLSLEKVVHEATALKSFCLSLIQKAATSLTIDKEAAILVNNSVELASKVIPQALLDQKAEELSASTSAIDASITHIQAIQEAIVRLEELKKQQIAIRIVEERFIKVADRIRKETKTVAENAVNALRSDVKHIYQKIHQEEAVPDVFIKLDTDEKTLNIRVNFHSTDRMVPPAGYLSEAQINTLGLALFFSSVRLFNREFPFIFLDDIVSSYDADNRARIVDVIAEDLSDFQIFLTTHDERFYTHLKGRLESENWLFERISGYDFERGPKRESDNLRPEQIDELIKQGDPRIAGNIVRQFMEEWFDNICDRFSVYTLHKKGSKDYKRTLFDYWNPLVERIKGIKGDAGSYILTSDTYKQFNGCLFPIINYYSHNQTNPYEWASIGDVVYVWEAFKRFMILVHCNNCGKVLQYHDNDKKLFCTCGRSILP